MEDKEWLDLARRKEDNRAGLKRVHGNFAADGYRAHFVNGKQCRCGNDQVHRNTETFIIPKGKESPFLFAISRQFLLDALAGIESDVLLFFGGEKIPIVIQSRTDDDEIPERTALIMPIHTASEEYAKFPTVYAEKPRKK